MQKLLECHKYGFLHALQIQQFICYHELEAEEEAVVHLIVPNHGNKGFRLLVYLLKGNVFQASRY